MAFYNREFIDYLLDAVDVDLVIRETGFVFRGNGNNPGTDCPKCGRDHTHMKWNRIKKMFQCKSSSCGFKGNVFQWVMETKGLSFPQSIEWIADLSGIELPAKSNINEQSRTNEILSKASSLFTNQNEKAIEYYKERGIEEETLRYGNVGYALGNRSLKEYLESEGYSTEELLSLRLLHKCKNNSVLDGIYRMAVIPIQDEHKKVIDLYCRSLDNSHSTKHLYLNGTRKILGAHLLKAGCKVVMIEGPADYLAYLELYIKGKSPYVPLCTGKAEIQRYHVNLLKKYKVSETLIAFDGDLSGVSGILEGGQLIKDMGLNTNLLVAIIKDGEDPSSIYQIEKKIDTEIIPFQEFKWKHQLAQIPVGFLENYYHQNIAKR